MSTPETKPELSDPVEAMREGGKSPELAAFLAWLIPGAGHIYAGHRIKGAGGLVFVLGLFLYGLGSSGGEAVSLRDEVGHPYAFLAQVGAGLPTGIGLLVSRRLEYPRESERIEAEYARGYPDRDAGLLFTMIAGLLNLLLIHDALNGVPGAVARRRDDLLRRERLAALREELIAKEAGESNVEPDSGNPEGAEAEEPATDSPQPAEEPATDSPQPAEEAS